MLKDIGSILIDLKSDENVITTLDVVRYSEEHPDWFVFIKLEKDNQFYCAGHFPIHNISITSLFDLSVEYETRMTVDCFGYSILSGD